MLSLFTVPKLSIPTNRNLNLEFCRRGGEKRKKGRGGGKKLIKTLKSDMRVMCSPYILLPQNTKLYVVGELSARGNCESSKRSSESEQFEGLEDLGIRVVNSLFFSVQVGGATPIISKL